MTDNTVTNNTKTREAHGAYRANRKAAGRVIDVETCKVIRCYCNYFDPYHTYPWDDDPPDDEISQSQRGYVGKHWFVRSDESDGWIAANDLPEEKWQALERRIEHATKLWERKQKLWEAACAAHPIYEVDTHEMATVGWFVWKGDGEEPSQDALIEWFKVNHPAQASVVESKIRRRELEIERQQAQDHPAVRG
jgi:hypothetical protein